MEGGDFDAFEVTLAAAVYRDERLIADLQSGQKIHALYGAEMYQAEYDDVLDSGTQYGRAKNAFFGSLYGAQDTKLAETLGITEEEVSGGRERFEARYPGVGAAQARIAEAFCSMRQPGGLGTRVEWHEPHNYVESLFGFRRFFTLENSICRALFEMAQQPPPSFGASRARVKRRERLQTQGGATQSALYGAAFQIQARNLRAAGNHQIQSSGAHICKRLQRTIWDQQPAGVHPWKVQPLNVHDEVLCPTDEPLADVVAGVVESFRGDVPLISMDWGVKASW